MKKGDLVHFEINAKDPQRAKRFYSKVFGWKFKDSEIPGIEYYVVDGVTPGGAVNPLQDEPGVVVYFGTDNIDQTLKDIRDGGGKTQPKQAIQGMGWFAPCLDPEGNKISLFQSDPNVTAETERQTARV